MPVSHPAVKAVPAALLSLSTLLALSISLLLTACGGGGGGSTTPATPTITSVTVVCSPASILTTQTSTCTATVQGTGSYSSAVTWAASEGTITSSGVFTPTVEGTVTITATSTENTSKSGTASITVGSPLASNEWTWMSGNDTGNAPGFYGTQGVASTNNVPGGRSNSVSWIDGSGNLWLFGGFYSYSSVSGNSVFNDLWEYNPTAKTWTWVSGSNTLNAVGIYGTQGTPAAGNVPGARSNSVSWIDSSGNLWLFGGNSAGAGGGLNDLWKFNPSTDEWTWVDGSNTAWATGVYGTLGTPSAGNVPGARGSAASWIDKSGNLWLFGGEGYSGNFNDLWEYNPTAKTWTWVSGSNTGGAAGIYGTQGVAAASNVPGGRSVSVTWIDGSGNLWLFGGGGLNDLWEFSPTTKMWTWVSGSNTAGAAGVYGTQGVALANNVPGARGGAVSWFDGSGNLWLFGGQGYDSTGTLGDLNDLWEFSITGKTWTWVSGSNTANAVGVYGTQGVASANNVPGERSYSVSWIDGSGNLWLFGGFHWTGAVGGSWVSLNDLWRYVP